MSWQPIETAPRDGTKIDLWFPYGIGRRTDWHWMVTALCWIKHEDDALDGYGDTWTTAGLDPTHWMPSPGKPEETT